MGPTVSKAKIEIARSQLSLGVNDVAILYIINKDNKEQTAVILDESSYSAQLNFGNWEFAVILWEGTGRINNDLRCGRASKKFSSEFESISIQVTQENCDDSFFSPSSYRSNGETKTLSILECDDLLGTTCTPTGGIQSFRLRFYSHFATLTSKLSGIKKNEFTTSDCLLIGESYLSLPFGGEDFNPPQEIEAYSDSSCNTSYGKYFFSNGVANFKSQTNDLKIASDSTNISILLKTHPSSTENLVGCLENEVITGFSGRSGAWIDQLAVRCMTYQNGTLSGNTLTRNELGGSNGSPFSDECPQGSAVVSITYGEFQSPYTGQIQFTCKSISNYSTTFTSPTYGGSVLNELSLICPTGKFLRSLDYQEVQDVYGSSYIGLIGTNYFCR